VKGAALAAVAALIALSGQSPAPAQAPAAAAAAPVALPAFKHLVYRFGYNTDATDSGQGTGTTTIDFVGPAKDGGQNVKVTDDWWNTVRPRQSYTCELVPGGNVTCPNPPYAISPIQIAIVPMLSPKYFAPLAANPNATWKASYSVKAMFAPIASGMGLAGQVNTWNGSYTYTGKGTPKDSAPLVLAQMEGQLAQQGGRYIKANQKANLLYDPHLKRPVFLNEVITFVPRKSVNDYTIQMKLIKYTKNTP
jgi:hypothetical protein